jgi:hypothetical protein
VCFIFKYFLAGAAAGSGSNNNAEEENLEGGDDKEKEAVEHTDDGVAEFCQLCTDFRGIDLEVRSPFQGYFPPKLYPVKCGTCGNDLVLKVQGELFYYISNIKTYFFLLLHIISIYYA